MNANMKRKYKVFHIDTEYYTFISGALISIPLSLMFEFADNYKSLIFWIALFSSLVSSLICFHLSIILKGVHEVYESNKKGVGDAVLSWNKAIDEQRAKCICLFVITIVTVFIAVVCVFIMQINSATELNVESVSQVVSTM